MKAKLCFKVIFTLLLCVSLLTSLDASTSKVDKSLTVDDQTSPYCEDQAGLNLSANDVNNIKNIINDYFYLRYESQKLLEVQDNSFLVSNEPSTQEWLQREKDRQEIELYVASTYRLNYVDYTYYLDYKKIQNYENKVDVTLNESHSVIFEASAPEVSKLFDLEHKITLKQVGNSWLIINDEYNDELSALMENESKGEIMQTVTENFQSELVQKEEQVEPEDLSLIQLTNYSYNRSAASTYATTWCNSYNSLYKDYSPNDCANFVSQAMYAGTNSTMSIVDTSHYMDWWYFTGSPRDGSYPWINVGGQKTYITTNTGQGPYGSVITSTCSLGVGDVIHLSSDSGTTWFHSIIVDAITNCSDTTKIFICGHTTARCHYPLSNYASYTKRYIHISGYRK